MRATEGDRRALIDELAERYCLPEREADDIDVRQVAERLGIGERAAYNLLNKETREGRLVCVKVRGASGHGLRVWRRK